MGQPPTDGHSLDRVNVNGDYAPENFRWATQREQMNNMSKNRVEVFLGQRLTIADAARKFNVGYHTVISRINRGWTPSEAVSVGRYKKIKHVRKSTVTGNTAIRA